MIGIKQLIGVVVLGFVVSGCASHTIVPTTGNHPPLQADQVTVYQTCPKKYEELGVITMLITPELRWDARGDAVAGIDRLKALAAAKGANGVLLKVKEGTFDFLAGVGYKGASYEVPIRKEPRTAVAEAIFVLEK